jgi:hypothetical protein
MGQVYSITVDDNFMKGSNEPHGLPVKIKSRYPIPGDKAGFLYLYTGLLFLA